MHVEVELELVRLHEGFAAEMTHTGFLLGVRASHVTVVSGVRGEGFVAVRALEGLLARVLPKMCAKNGGGCEGFFAVRAFVGFLSAVDAQVLVQAGGLREALTTLGALMRSILLVNVQNMDTKTITLLERAVAQMTGKLAVALIHAARVLEVLLQVRLVGECLAAPLAGKLVVVCKRMDMTMASRND